jgi:hypothetical protein
MHYANKTQGEASTGNSGHLIRLRFDSLSTQQKSSHYQTPHFLQTAIS